MLFALIAVVAAQGMTAPGYSELDRTGSGTLAAQDATCSVALAGRLGAGMQLAVGTLVGTLTPEVSFDNGTTWAATYFDDPTTGAKLATIKVTGPAIALTQGIVGSGGISNARVRVSTYVSGTVACSMRSSNVTDPSALSEGAASSTAQPPHVVQLGGWDVTATALQAATVKGAGAPPIGPETTLTVSSAELIRVRQLLEAVLVVNQQQLLLLQAIKDPGPLAAGTITQVTNPGVTP